MKAMAFVVVLLTALLSTAALAYVPGQISYQGTLTNEYGAALDTTVSMTFSIHIDSTGFIPLWTETQPSVEVSAGLFNVLLGSVTPIMGSDFPGPPVWLKVQVGGDPALSPLQKLVSVGYAFHAAEADTADYAHSAPGAADGDWIISGSDMYAGVSGKVGIGTSAPVFSLDIQDSYPFVRTQATAGNAGLVIDKFGVSDFGHIFYRTGGADRWATGLTGDDNYRFRYWPTTTDVMYLQSTGEVGIGTTSPAAKLDCPGPVRIGSPVFSPSSSVSLALCANDNTSSIPLAIVNTDMDYLMYIRGNGNVGLGTSLPSAKLDVAGTAKMTGFTMPTGAVSGRVLTSDASGNGTWQAPTALPDGDWTISDNHIYSAVAGSVGIGTTEPSAKLEVAATTGVAAKFTNSDSQSKFTVLGYNAVGTCAAFYAGTYPGGYPDTPVAVFGHGGSGSRGGSFVSTGDEEALVVQSQGSGPAIWAWAYGTGYSGYFTGGQGLYVSGNAEVTDTLLAANAGFGTSSPARPLHVNDLMRLEPREFFPLDGSDGDLCVKGTAGSRHIYCYLNGGWRQLD